MLIEKLSSSILAKLKSDGVIDEEMSEVYDYGIKLLIVNLTGVIVSLIIGILMKAFLETVTFLIVFAAIRRFSGGYHANTFGLCTIFTSILVVLLNIIHSICTLKLLTCIVITFISLIVFIMFSPIENENKILELHTQKICKVKSIIFLIGISLTGFLLYFLKINIYNVIFVSIAFVSFLIMVSVCKIFRKEKKYEEIV